MLRLKKLGITAILGLVPLSVSTTVFAGESVQIAPVLTQNQIGGISSYFDLKATPGSTQDLAVTVRNPSDHNISVSLKPANAITASGGGIAYIDKEGTPISKLTDDKYLMSKYMTVPNSVEVPAGGSVQVPVEVKVPDFDYGVILGGVIASANEASDNTSNSGETVVKNVVQNIIAVQLNSTDKQLPPKISFGDVNTLVQGTTFNISMDIKNDAPTITDGVDFEYSVYDANNKQISTDKVENIKLAPMSEINFMKKWDGDTLAAGTYTVKLKLTSKDGKFDTVSADKQFKIEDKQIQQYTEAVPQKTTTIVQSAKVPTWGYVVGVVVLIALIAVIFVMLNKMKKLQQKVQSESSRDENVSA